MQNTLHYIYEVYRECSFSQAAKNLGLSQPALSACIKKVEQELGAPLFDRSSLPIQLTEVGELYLHMIRQIMAAEHTFQTQLSELTRLERGHLVIAGANFFSAYVLPPILKAFSSLYPGVELEIMDLDTNSLYSESQREGIDLILDGGACDTQAFGREPLFNEQILFAVPKNKLLDRDCQSQSLSYEDILARRHRSQDGKGVDLSQFQQERLILLNRGHDMHMRSEKLCEHAGFVPRNVVYVNQLSTAANMAAQELGCCFVTDTLVRMAPIGRDCLRYFVVGDSVSMREVFIAWYRRGVKTQAMERFIEVARGVYATGADSRSDEGVVALCAQ